MDYIAPDLRALAVPVADLRPAERNARLHALDRDIPVLMNSLRRFGQRKPLVARSSTREVLAGNGTLMAARQLGWAYVAVAWFDGTDEEAQAYALADNRTAELSQWDLEELSAQLADITSRDAALPAALGWSEQDLSPLLAAEWAPPATEPLPDAIHPPVLIAVTESQHAIIRQAIARIRTSEGDDAISDGRCLELMAADFLSGP